MGVRACVIGLSQISSFFSTPTEKSKKQRDNTKSPPKLRLRFGGVFVLSLCYLHFSVGVGAFVIGLSQISSFSSTSTEKSKKQRDNTKTPPKTSITQQLLVD